MPRVHHYPPSHGADPQCTPHILHYPLAPPPYPLIRAPFVIPQRRAACVLLCPPLVVPFTPQLLRPAIHHNRLLAPFLCSTDNSVFRQPRRSGPEFGHCCPPPPHIGPVDWSSPLVSSRLLLRSASTLCCPLAPSACTANPAMDAMVPLSLPPLVPSQAASRNANVRRANIRRPMGTLCSPPSLVAPPESSKRTYSRRTDTQRSIGVSSCLTNTQSPMCKASCTCYLPVSAVVARWSLS